MKTYYRLWRSLLCSALLGATTASFAASAIVIESPVPNSKIVSLPQNFSVKFVKPLQTASVSIKLNGKEVRDKFVITDTGATGTLSTEDGIHPSLGKRGQLSDANVITVRARPAKACDDDTCAIKTSASFYLAAPVSATVSANVSNAGGTVTLPNYASIDFPAGAFVSAQKVTLSATATIETGLDWAPSAEIFGGPTRAAYEIRVNSGLQAPTASSTVHMNLPAEFAATFPAEGEVKVFVQYFQDAGGGILDSFDIVPATLSNGILTLTLPKEAFTNRRRVDATYEAVFLVGMTPTKPLPAQRPARRAATGVEIVLPPPPGAVIGKASKAMLTAPSAAAVCEGGKLSSPLDTREVTSPFNPPAHSGTDYRAADGTPVKSMADGKVENVGWDARPLPTPDPRSGQTVKGWGRYVVVRHADGSATLYAHMQTNGVSVKKGDSVKAGDTLGGSDNSGGSSGPHLHVEYAPNGKIYEKSSKVDVEPCIDLNTGSVSIRDNGTAADDAFSLFIGVIKVCSTNVGAANTCAIGKLRPGTISATLVCDIAPDDIGTYELSLGDGLKFSDGSTVRSGTLPQGGAAGFTVVIPGVITTANHPK